MADVFISYASADRDRARSVAQALERNGWTVFWDRTILPGKTFAKVIEDALEEAKAVVVLWSSASIKSDWVREEISDAARKGMLVPAYIERVTIPLGFRRYQAADLSEWSMDRSDQEFENLIRAIDQVLSGGSSGVATDDIGDVKTPIAPTTPEPAETKGSRTELLVDEGERCIALIHLDNSYFSFKRELNNNFGNRFFVNDDLIFEYSWIQSATSVRFQVSDGEKLRNCELWISAGFLSSSFQYKVFVEGELLLRAG